MDTDSHGLKSEGRNPKSERNPKAEIRPGIELRPFRTSRSAIIDIRIRRGEPDTVGSIARDDESEYAKLRWLRRLRQETTMPVERRQLSNLQGGELLSFVKGGRGLRALQDAGAISNPSLGSVSASGVGPSTRACPAGIKQIKERRGL